MGFRGFFSWLSIFFLFCTLAEGVLFSTLPKTLAVSASLKEGAELKVGEDTIKVSWGLNGSLPAGTDDKYAVVKVKLCFAPISQEDRAWRKTKDDLSKDKTCMVTIVSRAYVEKREESFEWTIERDVPTATYFIRAYAYDAAGKAVAYGQNTDGKKTTNLFLIQSISGRHLSLDIAAGVFSAFSIVSLFSFFYAEKRKGRRSQ